MLIVVWSAKGGSGASTVAVALAARTAADSNTGALLVDLAGDLPAVVGLADPEPGLTDWLHSGADVEALGQLEAPVVDGLALLSRGSATTWAPDRAVALAELLVVDHRLVVCDVGVLTGGDRPIDLVCRRLVEEASSSLAVTRLCYLGLRRLARAPHRPDGVVVVREPGRALDRTDVESLLSVPVVAEIDGDPAVARSIDAGLLARHAPRHLGRALRRVA